MDAALAQPIRCSETEQNPSPNTTAGNRNPTHR